MTQIAPPDPIFVLRGATSPVNSLAFMSKEEYSEQLLGGTQLGQIIIWDLKTKGMKHRWDAHKSSILWIEATNFNSVWSEGRSDSVVLWDLGNGNPVLKYSIDIEEYLGFCRCSFFDTGDKCFISIPGPSLAEIAIYEVNSKHKLCSFVPEMSTSRGAVMQCKWVTAELLLVSYESGDICLWNWRNSLVLGEINVKDTPMGLEFCKGSRKGICGTVSEKMVGFTLNLETNSFSIDKEFTITNSGISSCVSRSDEKIYAAGGWDHRIRIFSWKKHKPLAVLSYHKKTVECLTFSNYLGNYLCNGYLLAAGSSDHSVSLWDIFNT